MHEFCEQPDINIYQEYFAFPSLQSDFVQPHDWNQALFLYRWLVTVANKGHVSH